MAQASLLGWVKAPRKRRAVLYRFLRDLPEIMVSEEESAGPFKRGDLVSAEVLPASVWRVLLKRGVVEEYVHDLEWPSSKVRKHRKVYKG